MKLAGSERQMQYAVFRMFASFESFVFIYLTHISQVIRSQSLGTDPLRERRVSTMIIIIQ